MRWNPSKFYLPQWHVVVLLAMFIQMGSTQIHVPTSLSRCPAGSSAPSSVHTLHFEGVLGGENGAVFYSGQPAALEVAQHVYNTEIRYGSVKLTGSTNPAHFQNISQAVDKALEDFEHKNVVAVTGFLETEFTDMLSEIIKPRNLLHVDVTFAFQPTEPLISKLMNYEYVTALISANLLWEFGITRCSLVYYDTDTRWFEDFERYTRQLGITVEHFGVIPKTDHNGTSTREAIRIIKEKDIRYIVTHLQTNDMIALLAHAFDEGLHSEFKPVTWIGDARFTDENFVEDFKLAWSLLDLNGATTPWGQYAIFQSTNATANDILHMVEGSFAAFQLVSLNDMGDKFFSDVLNKTVQLSGPEVSRFIHEERLVRLGDAQLSIGYAVNSMSNAGYGCYLHHNNFTREAALTLYEFYKRVVAEGFSDLLEFNGDGDRLVKNYTVYNCHSHHRLPDEPRQGELKCVPHMTLNSLSGEILWKSDVPVIWHDGSVTPPSPPPDDGRQIPVIPDTISSSTIWHTEVIIILIISGLVLLFSFVLIFRLWRNYLLVQELLKEEISNKKSKVLNLDAPSTQALKMCDKIANGGNVTKNEALALSKQILRSRDLMQPDLSFQLDQSESPYNKNISAFLLQTFSNVKHSIRFRPSMSEPGKRRKVEPIEVSANDLYQVSSDMDSEEVSLAIDSFEILIVPESQAAQSLSGSTHHKLGYNLTFDITLHKTAHPLVVCTMHIIKRLELIEKLGLVESKLVKFLQAVESGYSDENSYHNATHAADVTMRLVCILCTSELYPAVVSDTDMLAAIIAAVIHDYGHLGKSNAFMVSIEHPIANQHNDQHVMENHSLCQCLGIMSTMNFTESLSQSDNRELRKRIIAMVLATDMKEHFRVFSQFKQKIRRDDSCESMSTWLDADQLGLVLETAIKVADLGHTTVHLAAHVSWVEALQTEFFKQGDEERSLGLEISPLCDGNKPRGGPASGENQVGFFEVICNPLFAAWAEVFPSCSTLRDQALINFGHWKQDAKTEC